MPIYEYQCVSCGKIISELRNLSESSLEKSEHPCQICAGEMNKIMSSPHGKVKGTTNPVKLSKNRG